MSQTIFHLDIDAFFASVEQIDFPELKGKPVIVGADPQGGKGRGVVSTASYEAREFGVHSAMPISQAYFRCPRGIFVKPRGKRYLELSRKIMKILYNFTPAIEPLSIDEAFMDLTGSLRLFGGAKSTALSMKQRIHEETGLIASIGIAPNKFIAKIASDLEKPDGLVIVKPGQEKTFLSPLPISKMWGIGKKTEPLFRNRGIHRIGQLAAMPAVEIKKLFGKSGMGYWYLANGIDNREVANSTGRHSAAAKSISKEITFLEDTDDYQQLELILFEIAEKLGRILHKKQLKAKTVNLKIRLEDFSTFTRSKSFSNFVNSSTKIRKIALELFRKFECNQMKVRLIGLGVSNFNENIGDQLSFFDDEDEPGQDIDDLIDLVENQFGEGTIKKATLLGRKR